MLRMTIVLGLAGLALVKAREFFATKFPAAKERVDKVRERIEPALREATGTVRSASKEAAESLRDASLSTAEAAESVANAIGNAATEQSDARSPDNVRVTS
jgi:hypothetical protein